MTLPSIGRLFQGLNFALLASVCRIRVYLDSDFIVDQMNHRSEVKQVDLLEPHNEALDLIASQALSELPCRLPGPASCICR